jgi:hypothetical protein
LVEHRYALRSKGKLILEDLDQQWGNEKPIPANAKRLPGNTYRLSRKTELKSGRTESELGKTELNSSKEKPVLGNANQLPGNVDGFTGKANSGTESSLGRAEPGPSYGCRLQEVLEPTSGKEDNEESITEKSESGNVGSPVDEEKMEPMKEYDSVKGGGMIRTDWRLPLLECIRDPRKTTDKKVMRQVLKYTLLDDDLYWRTIDDVLLKCLGEEQAKVAVQEVRDGICGAHQSSYKMNWLLRRLGFYWPTRWMIASTIKRVASCVKGSGIYN